MANSGNPLKIEHYILGKTLGIGAFGKVKLATHDVTGTHVAIKIINKKRMKQANMNTKIKREIRLLRYFNHPNIIRLYEVLDTTTDIFVVMEYISGGELFEVIASKGKLPENEAKHFFKQIIEGVEYCHQNLVTHRDLKPENILIDKTNTVKIADFGLSNLMKDGKYLKTPCGSPNYAAPEIITGKQYCGTEIDTWSCGVILYALIAGFLPFDEDIIPMLFKKIREADFAIPTHFSPVVRDLIKKLLDPNPMTRMRFHEIKLHAWIRESQPLFDIFGFTRVETQKKLNENVLHQLTTLNFDFKNSPEEKIKEAIKKRREFSFVVGYDLLLDEYNNKQKLENGVKYAENNSPSIFMNIRELLHNAITTHPDYFLKSVMNKEETNVITPKDWLYGIIFPFPAKHLIKIIYESLAILDTTIKIKSKDYKIKCFHKNPPKISTFRDHRIESDERDATVEEETRAVAPFSLKEESHKTVKRSVSDLKREKVSKYSKKEIIFTVQIYSMPSIKEHLIDVQLNKGHPILFMEFVNKFFNLVNKTLYSVNNEFSFNMVDETNEY